MLPVPPSAYLSDFCEGAGYIFAGKEKTKGYIQDSKFQTVRLASWMRDENKIENLRTKQHYLNQIYQIVHKAMSSSVFFCCDTLRDYLIYPSWKFFSWWDRQSFVAKEQSQQLEQ